MIELNLPSLEREKSEVGVKSSNFWIMLWYVWKIAPPSWKLHRGPSHCTTLFTLEISRVLGVVFQELEEQVNVYFLLYHSGIL